MNSAFFDNEIFKPRLRLRNLMQNCSIMEVILICQNQACMNSFIGDYKASSNNIYYFDGETTIGNLDGKEFSKRLTLSQKVLRQYIIRLLPLNNNT